MTSLTFHVSRSIGRDDGARRRDRRDDPRPRGQRRAVEGDRRATAGSSSGRSTSATPTARSTSRRSTRSSTRRTRLVAVGLGVERRRHDQPGRARSSGGPTPPARGRTSTRSTRRRTCRSTSRAVGTDFLACSTYKFFGPHAGVLYGRADVLDALPAYKLRPAERPVRDRHRQLRGRWPASTAAVDYLADIGVDVRRGRGARRPAARARPTPG